MLAIDQLSRVFKFKDHVLPDPDIDFSVEEVREFYSIQYPELVSATDKLEVTDENIVYTFTAKIGTKG